MASDFFGPMTSKDPKKNRKTTSSKLMDGALKSKKNQKKKSKQPSSTENDYFSSDDSDEMDLGSDEESGKISKASIKGPGVLIVVNSNDIGDDFDEGVDDYEDSDGDQGESEAAGPLSNHQLRQQELARKIADLEKEAIEGKKWDMMGEARGQNRPENSLLEVSLDVER